MLQYIYAYIYCCEKYTEASFEIHKLFNMAKAVSVPIEIQTWPQKVLKVNKLFQ